MRAGRYPKSGADNDVIIDYGIYGCYCVPSRPERGNRRISSGGSPPRGGLPRDGAPSFMETRILAEPRVPPFPAQPSTRW